MMMEYTPSIFINFPLVLLLNPNLAKIKQKDWSAGLEFVCNSWQAFWLGGRGGKVGCNFVVLLTYLTVHLKLLSIRCSVLKRKKVTKIKTASLILNAKVYKETLKPNMYSM